jgi:hypothetical protein
VKWVEVLRQLFRERGSQNKHNHMCTSFQLSFFFLHSEKRCYFTPILFNIALNPFIMFFVIICIQIHTDVSRVFPYHLIILLLLLLFIDLLYFFFLPFTSVYMQVPFTVLSLRGSFGSFIILFLSYFIIYIQIDRQSHSVLNY